MLTAAELAQCRRAFLVFDRNSDGVIDLEELRASLATLGHADVSDAALQVFIDQVDKDRSGHIEFDEFLQVIEAQKAQQAARGSEADWVEAFVALGGQADGSGHVSVPRLAATLAAFDLRVDLAGLLDAMDKDADGTVTYDEFKALLQGGQGGGSGGGDASAAAAACR